MLEDDFHESEGRSCVKWYHEEESGQGPIGHTLLQVDYHSSDGIHYLLSSHGGIFEPISVYSVLDAIQ